MDKKVKWGVLGCARIAVNHVIPAILKASNSELYAIASRDAGKAGEYREKFGCPKAYSSYDQLLEDPEVDAVYIPLPNHLHKEWTIKAARKGKHVLCEKPIALNSQECMEMIEECGKNRVKLMEAFMYRYSDRIGKVKELVDSGVIGEVKYIHGSFGFYLTWENDVRMAPEMGGGSLYDIGCYPINFIGMITGRLPVTVSAERILENGVDVSFSAVLNYDDKLLATMNSGFRIFQSMFAEIAGTKGVIEVPDPFAKNAGVITIATEEGKREVAVKHSEYYVLQVEDFADAVIHDREPMFSLEETARNMEVIDRLLACKK